MTGLYNHHLRYDSDSIRISPSIAKSTLDGEVLQKVFYFKTYTVGFTEDTTEMLTK